MTVPWLAIGLAAAGVLLLGAAGYGAWFRSRRSSYGRIESVDLPSERAPLLRSERWRLSGRPDEIRVLPDGTRVPVEIKSRPGYRHGPPASHRAQVAAYCLLLEESTGRPPPYGILRYGDGSEYRIPWGAPARSALHSVRREMARGYDGRASPSPGKCRGCTFRGSCDRSQAPA